MGYNHTVDGSQAGSRAESQFLQRQEYAWDNDLENRIRKLERLVDTFPTPPERRTFSGTPRPLDIVNDIRAKIKANRDLFRIARLLSDPARESMFLKIRDSLDDLEQSIAYHLGEKTI
jgi:hypothetical protein